MTTTTTYPAFVRLGPDLIREILDFRENRRQKELGFYSGHGSGGRSSRRQIADHFEIPKKMVHEILDHPDPIQLAHEAAKKYSEMYGPRPSRDGWHLHRHAKAIEALYHEGVRAVRDFREHFPDLNAFQIRQILCAMTGNAAYANHKIKEGQAGPSRSDAAEVLATTPLPQPEVDARVAREIVGVWIRGFTVNGQPATREQEMAEMETLFALPRQTIIRVLEENGYAVSLALEDSRETPEPPRRWNFIAVKS